jgi:hypothetical protein
MKPFLSLLAINVAFLSVSGKSKNYLAHNECFDLQGTYLGRCSEFECCGTITSYSLDSKIIFNKTDCLRPEFHSIIMQLDDGLTHSFRCQDSKKTNDALKLLKKDREDCESDSDCKDSDATCSRI